MGIILLCMMILGNIDSPEGSEENFLNKKTQILDPLTITIIYDNNPHDARLRTAWGFSCLVKYNQKNILFDTGGKGSILLHNMENLQIDPKEVDIVVLSHLHSDHTGGIVNFLKENSSVIVYLPKSFPQKFKDIVERYGAKIEEVHSPREIIPGIYTTGELGEGIKEQSLLLKTSQGFVVITGCAHPGITRIIKTSKEIVSDKLYLVLGGFHLGEKSPSVIKALIQTFKTLEVEKVAPCHCTGVEAKDLLHKSFGRNYIDVGVGKKIIF